MPSFLPSYAKGTETKIPEILAGYSPPPLKKGGTVKPGQGQILIGQTMARDSVSKMLVKYATADAGSPGVAVGFLGQTVDTGDPGATAPVGANIYLGGVMKLDALIDLDAGAIADLNGRSDTNRNFFVF